MKRILGLVIATGLALSAPAAWAQEGDDYGVADQPRRTLADRIPSVTGRVFEKQGRLEISPAFVTSINDPFYRNIGASGALTYHILESLAVSASGEFYAGLATDIEVGGGGDGSDPDYNRPLYAARLEASWSPIYGKISLLAESVIHFDTYLSLGGGVIGATETSTATVGTAAIGQRFFANEWFAVRWEIRDQIFELARNPEVRKSKELQNYLTFTLGASLFIPSGFEREVVQ